MICSVIIFFMRMLDVFVFEVIVAKRVRPSAVVATTRVRRVSYLRIILVNYVVKLSTFRYCPDLFSSQNHAVES